MGIDKRKLKKQKKREEKLKKQKLSALNSNNQELNKTQKSFGKIQIALVIVVTIIGAGFIILNS